MIPRVQIKRLRPDAILPKYQTEQAAGLDLHACLGEAINLEPGHRAAVGTGLAIALPAGYEAQLRPRSGLARAHGVTLVNTPGTIDADYTGEIIVLLINHGTLAVVVSPGGTDRADGDRAGLARDPRRGRRAADDCAWRRRLRIDGPVIAR